MEHSEPTQASPERLGDQLEAILARVHLDDRADERAAEHRLAMRRGEALAVRDRVPAFVRHARPQELAARVKHPHLLEVARTWRWGAGNVLFAGPTDIGKSTAAALLFRALLARAVTTGGREWDMAKSMQWFGAERLAAARREQRMGAGEAPDVLAAIHARLLVLDDAGWDRDPLAVSEVTDARYEFGHPTIITTGKSKTQLIEHYGEAVVRRMLDRGGRRAIIVDAFAKIATVRSSR